MGDHGGEGRQEGPRLRKGYIEYSVPTSTRIRVGVIV